MSFLDVPRHLSVVAWAMEWVMVRTGPVGRWVGLEVRSGLVSRAVGLCGTFRDVLSGST